MRILKAILLRTRVLAQRCFPLDIFSVVFHFTKDQYAFCPVSLIVSWFEGYPASWHEGFRA